MTFTNRPSTNGHTPTQLHVAGSDGPVTPPHNRDAEEAVIGSVFKNGLALADIVTFLKPAHFYHPPYRYVYAAMVALFERGASIDYHGGGRARAPRHVPIGGWVDWAGGAERGHAELGAHHLLRAHRRRSRTPTTLHRCRATGG